MGAYGLSIQEKTEGEEYRESAYRTDGGLNFDPQHPCKKLGSTLYL